MATASDKAIEELKTIGYTDEKIKELLKLLLPEVTEYMLLDLAGTCTDEELNAFEDRMKKAKTQKEYESLMTDMAKKAYGNTYSEKLDEVLADMLKEMGDMTLRMRKAYHDYMSGDADTKKKVEEFEKSDEYKEIKKEFEDSGFDLKAAASE